MAGLYTLQLETSNGTYGAGGLVIALGGDNVASIHADGTHNFNILAGALNSDLTFKCLALNDFIGDVDNVILKNDYTPIPDDTIQCSTILYASHVDTDIDNVNTGNSITTTLNGDAVLSTIDSKFGIGSAHIPLGNDSSYLLVTSDIQLSTTQTVELFFKITEESLSVQYNGIIGGFGNNLVVYADFINDNGRLEARVGSDAYASNTNISTNIWYHLAVTFNNGDVAKIYLDGINVLSTKIIDIGSAAQNVMLGSGGTAFGAGELGGYIDDVIITNTTKYTENFTPPTAPFETTC